MPNQKSRDSISQLETDQNSVSVTVFRPKPPKNMVSAWFQLRQKGTAELRFRPKLDHVETETSRNWISSVSCSDLQSDDVFFLKQWAGPQVHSASPPQPTRYGASRLVIKAGVLCTVLNQSNQTTPDNVLSVPCECDSVLNV